MGTDNIPTTSLGWPYLTQDTYVDRTPEYSRRLADKLEKGEADLPAAINAATRAEKAAASIQGGGLWSDYTPTLKTNGTALSIGSGTLRGRWCRIGNIVHATIYLQRAANTHIGTGMWTFDLPVSVAATYQPVGVARLTNGGQACIAMPTTATTISFFDLSFKPISNTNPANWSDGHVLSGSFTYEAA